jgi:hypothetical protein
MRRDETRNSTCDAPEHPQKAEGHRPRYGAPRLVRVRVETARMKLGYNDANTYCTIHDHDTGINPCAIS